MSNKVYQLECHCLNNYILLNYPTLLRSTVLHILVDPHLRWCLLSDICLILIGRSLKIYLKVKVKIWKCLINWSLQLKLNKLSSMDLVATLLLSFTKIYSIVLILKHILLACIHGSHYISLLKSLSLLLKDKKSVLVFGEITHRARFGMNGQWVSLILSITDKYTRHRFIILMVEAMLLAYE